MCIRDRYIVCSDMSKVEELIQSHEMTDLCPGQTLNFTKPKQYLLDFAYI